MSKHTEPVKAQLSNKNAVKAATSQKATVAKQVAKPISKVEASSKPVNNFTASRSVKKSPKVKPVRKATSDQMADNPWGNIFDASVTEDIRENVERFMESANSSICGSNAINNHANDLTKDMVTKLSNNIRHNFEQTMELSQSILKCKTAADFVEFQRKNFEMNYKNTTKLYSDLFHDMQNLVNQSLKDSAKYTNDSTKGFMS